MDWAIIAQHGRKQFLRDVRKYPLSTYSDEQLKEVWREVEALYEGKSGLRLAEIKAAKAENTLSNLVWAIGYALRTRVGMQEKIADGEISRWAADGNAELMAKRLEKSWETIDEAKKSGSRPVRRLAEALEGIFAAAYSVDAAIGTRPTARGR